MAELLNNHRGVLGHECVSKSPGHEHHEQLDACLQIRLLPVNELGIIELQIARLGLCSSSDIFFTPAFLTVLRLRFQCG